MTIRLNTMARGHSGVRAEVAELLAAMLNADLVPWVPSGARWAPPATSPPPPISSSR